MKLHSSLQNSKIKDNMAFAIMALPAVILVIVFAYLPMAGIVVAFQKFNVHDGFLGSPWVGLDNFKFFFTSIYAGRVFRNTILLRLLFLTMGNIVPVIFAFMMFELRSRRAIKVYQTVSIIPSFLSWVVIGYISYTMLSPIGGILNRIITAMGGTEVSWYSNAAYWPIILLIVYLWNTTGTGSLFYFASLMGMDTELLEAAQLDGASKGQIRRYILLPHLMNMIIIMNILNIGHLLQSDFGLFFIIPRDQAILYSTTDVIETYVYRALINLNDIGMSGAVSLFQSFVGFILVLVTNTIVRKISPENAMF